MNSTEALNVSASIQKLIIEKLNDEISQKELINKKLSPFLLHEVFTGKISSNFTPMIQDVERKPSKTLHNKEIEVEPKGLQKDNMNPKNAQIEQGSSVHLKSQTKTPRRFTFSSKKQSFLDTYTQKDQNTIDQQKYHLQSKTMNSNRSIEITSMPKLSRKLSKPKNQPIKLNLKKQSIHEAYDELESVLRSKKIRQEEQQMKDLQFEALKSKRYEKLKQKFKIYKNNAETISFDFDGSIINLQDDQEDKKFEKKPAKFNNVESKKLSQSRTFQTIPVEDDDSFISKHNGSKNIGLPFQTIYRIHQKDINSISSYQQSIITGQKSSKNNHIQQKNNSHLSPSQNQQSLAEWHLSLNSQMKKKSSNIYQSISQESSLESSLHLSKKKALRVVKIFRDSSSGQKSARKQKQAKILHEEGQKEFTNNFKRQTSTIPYLEITEGIRYQQEITIKDDENDLESQKVRFATIEKPRNGSQNSVSHHQGNTMRSNLTFRSYLTLSQQAYHKSKDTLHSKTIQAFSQSGKSFKFCFHRDQKQSQELKRVNKTNKMEDEFAFFDNPNPIVIRDESHNKANTCRPRTTQTGIRMHQNRVQSSRPFFEQRNIKDIQLLEMKQKMLLKQKNRVMSSHTARIMK